MKKIIQFSKGFLPAAVISCAIIVSGIIGIAVRGINFGLDFKPGLIEEVRIAPPAIELSYSGSANIRAEATAASFNLIISGAGADNRTEEFAYHEYPTVRELSEKLNSVEGISSKVVGNADASTYNLFVDSASSAQITSEKYRLYVPSDEDISVDEVRSALSSFDGVAVKELGSSSSNSYQIRLGDSGEENSSKQLADGVTNALSDKFGAEKVAVVKTDFIGSQFSTSLVQSAFLLVAATLLLIWAYAAVRFHWDFALGSVVAIVHDALVVLAFMSWTQLEFSTTTLAAILTIVGYSINATVVILDRVRSDMQTTEATTFNDILNSALTGTLSRSLVTTVTTLFAVVSLFVFTSGSIKDFALALIVGLLSGCYSSIFISSGLISFIRRNWKPGKNSIHVFNHEVKNEHVIEMQSE
jgi:preprotein translocase subunit SecF